LFFNFKNMSLLGLDPPPPSSSSSLFERNGIDCFLRGDFDGAITYFSDGLEESGGDTRLRLLSNRSAAHIARGTIKSFYAALEDAKELVSLAPTSAKSHYRLGLALRSRSKFSQARLAFLKGVECAEAEENSERSNELIEDGNDRKDSTSELESALASGYIATSSHRTRDSEAIMLLKIAMVELERMSGFEGGGDHPDEELLGEEAGDMTRFVELEDWLLRRGSGNKALSETTSSTPSLPLHTRSVSTGFSNFPSPQPSISHFPYLHMRRYSENNRGVHLRCDIPAETELLAVGLDYLITVEMGRSCPPGRRLAAAGIERDLSASKHCYLAIFVLWDRKNPKSFFQPYYSVLPDSYPNMPIFWSDDQLLWLRGSFILQQIEDRRANIRSDYELITKAIGAENMTSIATFDEFLWARMVVASRNFGIVVDGIRTDALVPYADMLNHSRPRQTRWQFDSRRKTFLIISQQALHAGSQVFDSYGKKCNSRFLLNYGFAVDHNCDDDVGQDHNELRLLIGLLPPREDPWHARKQELLGGMTLLQPPFPELEVNGVNSSSSKEVGSDVKAKGDISLAGDLEMGRAVISSRDDSSFSYLGSATVSNDQKKTTFQSSTHPIPAPDLRSMAALDMSHSQTPARSVRISTFAEYDGTIEAFSFLRFVHAKSFELLHLPRMEEDFDLARRPILPLSCSNECAVLSHLRLLCEKQLRAYPSSIEEDEELLKSGRLSYGSNRRNALVLILGEKRVCSHYISLSKYIVPIFEDSEKKPTQELLSIALSLYERLSKESEYPSDSKSNTSKYIQSVVIPLLQKKSALDSK
jgi:hypothetical protein